MNKIKKKNKSYTTNVNFTLHYNDVQVCGKVQKRFPFVPCFQRDLAHLVLDYAPDSLGNFAQVRCVRCSQHIHCD